MGEPLKKDIKWYTYVDQSLELRLEQIMGELDTQNRAEIIRSCVNSYLNFVDKIRATRPELGGLSQDEIERHILDAINQYSPDNTKILAEFRQWMSPLKTSILLMSEILNDPEKIAEIAETAKESFSQLEKLIQMRFGEPNPQRFFEVFDILYVEDNELERNTVQEYFRLKGTSITSVETSEEGLEILKQTKPKVILLDLNLKTSSMDGITFCNHLKKREEFQSIPVVILTAMVTSKEVDALYTRTGANEIILKPIDSLSQLDLVLKYL